MTVMNNDSTFYGHGKLLLSGEYFVLEGATALALPTKLGQSLCVKYKKSYNPKLHWVSYDHNGKKWFDSKYEFWRFNLIEGEEDKHTILLQKILRQVRKQNPHFLREERDVFVETRLEFPLEWGLGSSSTLIYNIAKWAYVSPFELQFRTMGGSGYDIACAQADGPIVYQKTNRGPSWSLISFDPPFKESLYFVYLGRKQDSRDAIKLFQEKMKGDPNFRAEVVSKLSSLTTQMVEAKNLADFEFLLRGHEEVMSKILDMSPLQKRFPEYWGAVKSLGAWGGDFALVTSNKSVKETKEYFLNQGLSDFFPYHDLIKENVVPSSKSGILQ